MRRTWGKEGAGLVEGLFWGRRGDEIICGIGWGAGEVARRDIGAATEKEAEKKG